MQKRDNLLIIRLLLIPCILFFISACRINNTTALALSIHRVIPSTTDSSITVPNVAHYAGVNTNNHSKNTLVIFLCGTGSDASGYGALLKHLVLHGYHVVSINYPNANSIGSMAGNDLAEYGKLRQEIVEGVDSSKLINITHSNSIENRVNKLIKYLAVTYPEEGWGIFLADNEIIWPKVIISGFSQGAGHSAYIAKKYPVDRAVLFSGVVDGRISQPYQSATWLTDAENQWATPFSRFRFFININDGYYPSIRANLITFGYTTDNAMNVDKNNPPYGNKNVLYTSLAAGDHAHPSTCVDIYTPKAINNLPVYQSVWETLFN